jgi:hypothetical protein
VLTFYEKEKLKNSACAKKMSHGHDPYLKEEEAKNVSDAEAGKQLYIPINCGEFSYAEILNKYLRVFGVSGTLPVTDEDRTIVEGEYNINRRTKVPSIFGKNKLAFYREADTRVEEDESNWSKKIKEETMDRIEPTKGTMRSVIVVFESIGTLRRFENEPAGGQALAAINGVKVQKITEENTSKEKERLVEKASCQGAITYITRALGRGTDFICLDTEVEKNGGVHVLQTFWSIDQSESIQIQGRTARQGQNGSYSLVLCNMHLERLGFEKDAVTAWKDANTIYGGLEGASLQLNADKNAPRVESATTALARHEETITMYANPSHGDVFEQFLKSRNPSPASLGATKVIIALDGTCSMTTVIGKTKAAIGEMLARIDDVLLRANASDAAYEIQIVAYRNYNANLSNELLQVSNWEASPMLLADFLGTVAASYGWGEEAVELALAHAVRQSANLVIVIGDADAQTQEEAERKRLESATHAWNSNPHFSTATYFEPEAKLLAEQECPVSTFYVSKTKKIATQMPPNLQSISDITEGVTGILDVNHNVSDALTDTVCTQILDCLGRKNDMDLTGFYQPTFAV